MGSWNHEIDRIFIRLDGQRLSQYGDFRGPPPPTYWRSDRRGLESKTVSKNHVLTPATPRKSQK